MHSLDSNKVIEKIYKKADETDSIVVKPANQSQLLSRPKVCSLKNAIEVNSDGKLFCLAHFGQRKHKDALELCEKLNAKLPLPTSITEHNHFTESFKDATHIVCFLYVIYRATERVDSVENHTLTSLLTN